ncbi:Mitochondrial fission protein ELM1-like [Sesbania bispinosa]|nr:Mitochondrial fission protein ELM1-like [Sesbania bispinosa]
MRPIQLPEPPSPTARRGTPEIFESGVHTFIRRAVVIGNGFPASENQSIGLVRALGFSEKYHLYRVTRPKGGINEWLQWLPVSVHKKLYYIVRMMRGYSQLLLKSQEKKLMPLPSENGVSAGLLSVLEADVKQIVNFARETYEKEGPLLVVACGRDTISTSSSIKRLASENVFVVQKQVPRFLRSWITPREPPDSHVVCIMCIFYDYSNHRSPTSIDFTSIRSVAVTWHDEFAHVPRPLLVVNIGGPTSNCRYGVDLAKQLAASLLSVLDSCGSVRISFSERTPQKVSSIIVKELGNNPKVYIWDGQGPNLHMGHLAWADAFVVTADSVSMISEACSTGPSMWWELSVADGRFTEFHKSLRDLGGVRPFTGSEDISESWSYPPLNETADAAKRVHEALAARGIAKHISFIPQIGNTDGACNRFTIAILKILTVKGNRSTLNILVKYSLAPAKSPLGKTTADCSLDSQVKQSYDNQAQHRIAAAWTLHSQQGMDSRFHHFAATTQRRKRGPTTPSPSPMAASDWEGERAAFSRSISHTTAALSRSDKRPSRVSRHGAVALKCINPSPKNTPSMSQVAEMTNALKEEEEKSISL